MTILEGYAPGEVCFIHIPRTGGRSVVEATGLETSHQPWFRRSSKVPILYSFTVLRNPWEQIASWYHSNNIRKRYQLSLSEYVIAGFPDIKTMEENPRNTGSWLDVHPFDQLGRAGEGLDDYFRLEDREVWWPTLIGGEILHVGGKRRAREDVEVWTGDAVEAVEDFASDTIERFHYLRPEEVTL